MSEYFDIEKKPVENIHASDIKNVLKSLTSTVEIGENTASKGDYTHFYTGENSNADNEYCKGGNCLVPGGDYGITRGYEYQNIKVTNKCTMLSGGEKGYYCFGSDFESQSAGKYDTRVAQGGNPVVQIGNPKLDDKFFNSPVAYSDADSILPNESNGMHVYDNVNSTNFGAGGGGGGFTMFISKEPSCALVKLNGKIDVYVDTAYKLTSVTNTEKTVFKDKITCKEGALSKNGYKVTLKRTNGGRGNGGAVIIKW